MGNNIHCELSGKHKERQLLYCNVDIHDFNCIIIIIHCEIEVISILMPKPGYASIFGFLFAMVWVKKNGKLKIDKKNYQINREIL